MGTTRQIYQYLQQQYSQALQGSTGSLGKQETAINDEYRRQLGRIETERQLGQMSAAQAIAQEGQLLRQKWALNQQYFTEKREALVGDGTTQQQIYDDEAIAYQRHLTEQLASNRSVTGQMQDNWQSTIKPIADQLATFTTDVITRSKSVAKALDALLRSTVETFMRASFREFFGSVFDGGTSRGDADGSPLGLIGGLLGGFFRDSIGAAIGNPFSSSSGGLLGGSLMNVAPSIGGWLGLGGTGPAGFLLPGTIAPLAPEAFSSGGSAATAIAGSSLLSKLTSMLPVATGGWVVPHFAQGGIVSILHQREMVLPAHISDGLQSMIAAGGGHTINISAVDGASVARLFRNNGAALVTAINRAARHGSLLSPTL